MGIAVSHVAKHYGDFRAVDDVSLTIESGSLVALLGPSGSGKSTLLRIIAGLELPDSGTISLIGRDATHQKVQERNIGFVFQHYALFKHMTVRQNIAFPLELRKVPVAEINNRVDQLLELIQLAGYGNRYPSQLSGGQRQRVALARALSVQPQILLLDEPFGALDAKVRKELRSWLHRLHKEVNVTTVFVTHDQEEAMEVADQVVVMNRGKIEQVGTPAEIYDNPASSFVMSFVGPVNVLSIFPGSVAKWAGDRSWDERDDWRLFLRPHDIEIITSPDENALPATVDRVMHLGWEVQVHLQLHDGPAVTASVNRDRYQQLQIERKQQVYARPKAVRVFPLAT